jgi:cysteine synthase A
MPATFDPSLIDRVIKITDDQALGEVRLLARREGVLAGTSSGAALAAVRILLKDIRDANVAVVLPDRGDRYVSKNLFPLEEEAYL